MIGKNGARDILGAKTGARRRLETRTTRHINIAAVRDTERRKPDGPAPEPPNRRRG
jgi:hypothetical protein